MLRTVCALLLLPLLLAAKPALAFGDSAHQLICTLAYQLSSEPVRNKLDRLAQQGTEQNFNSACNWADEVRSVPEHSWSAPLHFINIPRNSSLVLPAQCPAQGCILSGISLMRQRLQEDNADWQALLFLAHFIADLHQPLHVSYIDDLGGSRTAVYFFGQPTNLHAIWDYALLHHGGYQQQGRWPELFSRLTLQQTLQWQQGTIRDWADESAQITQDIYQHFQGGMLLREEYVQQQMPKLEQRLLQAGVRLAWLLEQVLANAN